MTKITKIGLSALCGSLAALVSANAGEISVAGGATATYSQTGGDDGNPIGLNSGLTFTGSGELDGGQTFALTITQADQTAFSAGSLVLTTNNLVRSELHLLMEDQVSMLTMIKCLLLGKKHGVLV